jgi:acyl-CoA thioesterase
MREWFPNEGPGGFPILDMHKVDMAEFNKDKDIVDRRELILYRPLASIPPQDFDAHIACHAFEADRNGLLMMANHLGYGRSLGAAASLSNSFYVHVNGEEAVMKGNGWWLQEVSYPRASAGRIMMEVKIWSPEGKHVASGYQDGIVVPREKSKRAAQKL